MKLLSVLQKDLLILLRNKANLAVLFLMPLAFIIPISLALGAGDGYGLNRNNRMILLSVVDYDGGPHAERLLTAIGESLALEKGFSQADLNALRLAQDPDCADIGLTPTGTPTVASTGTVIPTSTPLPTDTPTPTTPTPGPTPTITVTPIPRPYTIGYPSCSEIVARAMLQRSWRTAALIIPPDFSKTIDEGKSVEVVLLYDPTGDAIRFQQVEGVIKGATMKISVQNQVNSGLDQLNDLAAFAPPDVQASVSQNTGQAREPFPQPAIRMEKVEPSNYTLVSTPDTYQQTVPGYVVMYVFFIITSMTASIRAETYHGTFRRLLSMPISRSDLLGGKLLATIVVGLAQVLILFAIGSVLFKLYLGSDPLAFLVLSVALVACAAALGLAAATTNLSGGALAAPLVIAALLGGCMFPLDLMPPFLRTLSYFVPHAWALTGYQNLMVRGLGLNDVLPQIGVLLGFALLFFLIAIRRFDFEK